MNARGLKIILPELSFLKHLVRRDKEVMKRIKTKQKDKPS